MKTREDFYTDAIGTFLKESLTYEEYRIADLTDYAKTGLEDFTDKAFRVLVERSVDVFYHSYQEGLDYAEELLRSSSEDDESAYEIGLAIDILEGEL